jgi:hypothetical protein
MSLTTKPLRNGKRSANVPRMRWIATAVLVLTSLMTVSAQQEKPLPDRTNFLIEFQVKRPGIAKMFGPSDSHQLLAQYTYKETVSEMSLDSNGKTKKTKTEVFERIPTRLWGHIYRRQIVKNGVPLTQKELDKQDRQNEEFIVKEEANRKKRQAESAKRQAQSQRKTDEIIFKELDKLRLTGEERKIHEKRMRDNIAQALARSKAIPPKMEDSWILMATDFQLVRREVIAGVPTILMTFKPNPKYKSGGDVEEKILQSTVGRAWVSEDDYQLVKIEAEVTSPINFGMGLLAKVQPGSKGVFEWRKINNEVWLPYREDFTGKVRILLVKGQHARELHEYSGHKKYVVSTELKFEGTEN